MVRYNRMKGRPTLWLPGTDHAGIATQVYARSENLSIVSNFSVKMLLNDHLFFSPLLNHIILAILTKLCHFRLYPLYFSVDSCQCAFDQFVCQVLM
jgi:hypothetical protein